ncbi:MAG: hypothetical protein LBS43_10255 [Prevotellaceae bacterium]|nr:hypothetical protein [Prevotellaceae bacterium]
MKLIYSCILVVFIVFSGNAQQIRFDNLKEQYNKDNLLKINGGVSANTVFYSGDNPMRDRFTWILSGNVNVSFFNQFNLPFSFNFNNLGGAYTYPTMPNRLSLHPVYKWVAAHIGDVSMTFSPYTLSGHQFTGAGVDLTPEHLPLKVSIMYGRLLKATEYNPDERLNMPAYKRMGYGAKVLYDKDKYSLGMSFFSAKDYENSLKNLPDSLAVLPQNNVAMSWEAGLRLIKNLTLTVEYGISLLTRDRRINNASSFFDRLFNQNSTSSTYHALHTDLSYRFMKNTISFGYERVDPEYQSLGAYYFTNDMENYTVSYARPFFKDKLTFTVNAGLQHDNLDNNKSEEIQRFVGSANLNYNHSERLNVSLSYSNFQSYTNIKSQFDYINEITDYDNLDTLNFTQLSQNATLNINWNIKANETQKHNISFNLNYQEAADKQNDMVRTGGASQFYNFATNYGLLFIPQSIQINTSANVTYNTVGYNNMLTYGPSIGAATKLFNNNLTTGITASYNVSTNNGDRQNSIFNLRLNIAYTILKKHNLNAVLINQSRKMKEQPKSDDITLTFGYMYNF